MRARWDVRRSFALAGSLLFAAASVSAETVATFADPSPGPQSPVFQRAGDTLTGGWAAPGLTLITPINAQSYTNVTFTMTPLAISGANLSAGNIQFFQGPTLLFRMDFQSAELSTFGFGATSLFSEDNVEFSGAIIPNPSIIVQEWFSFSFANLVPTANGYKCTASFTSSAVPEPSALALLAGLAGLLRRRT